jgi:hypothetical protein
MYNRPMTTTQIAAIARATEVIADNAARRVLAGQRIENATQSALAEFAERWPHLATAVAISLSGDPRVSYDSSNHYEGA